MKEKKEEEKSWEHLILCAWDLRKEEGQKKKEKKMQRKKLQKNKQKAAV